MLASVSGPPLDLVREPPPRVAAAIEVPTWTAMTDSMPFLSVASIPMPVIAEITIEGATGVIETGPVLPFFGIRHGVPRG